MNLIYTNYSEPDSDYQLDAERRGAKDRPVARSRRMQYSRTSRPSVMHNGIHRRRNKRFAW